MLSRYTHTIYAPTRTNRSLLVPSRRVRWGLMKRDIGKASESLLAKVSNGLCDAIVGTATGIGMALGWMRDRLTPSVPNPFDRAWNEVIQELVFEAV